MTKPLIMEKKICKDCNENERKKGRSYCQKCYWKRFGKASNTKYSHYRRNYKDQNRKFIHRYKQRCGCAVCNEKRWWILDLHHVDPSKKDFDFFHGVSRKRDVLKNEIRKCIVLCKTHHYDFHHQEKHFNVKLKEYIKNEKNTVF